MIPVKLFFTNSRKRELFFHHREKGEETKKGWQRLTLQSNNYNRTEEGRDADGRHEQRTRKVDVSWKCIAGNLR